MSFKPAAAKVFLAALLLTLACTDTLSDPQAIQPEFGIGSNPPTVCSVDSPATQLIDCLFPPPGLVNAAQKQLANIKRQYDRGEVEEAREMMFALVDFLFRKRDDGTLLYPTSLTQEEVVSLLVDRLYETVGLEPMTIPESAFTPEGAVEVVGPSGAVVAPETGIFGFEILPDALPEDAIIVVERLPDPTVAGEGPLPTDMDQYGPFFSVSVSSNVTALEGIVSGHCYYNSGPFSPGDDPALLASLRLARTIPGEPEEIKVLDPGPTPSFLDCSDVPLLASAERIEARLLAMLKERAGAFLGGLLGPESLRAQTHGGDADTIVVRGGGAPPGYFMSFLYSSVALGSGTTSDGPDLVVTDVVLVPALPRDEEDITFQVTVANQGNEASGLSSVRIYDSDIPSAYSGYGTVDPIDPGGSFTVNLVFAGGLLAGDYPEGRVHVDPYLEVPETNEQNNLFEFGFTVGDAPAPSAIAVFAGNGQIAPWGTVLPQPIAVRVLDQYGDPAPGLVIDFSVFEGGGSVSPAALTNAVGMAVLPWTLGPAPGQNQLKASVATNPSLAVQFSAMATLRPASLTFAQQPTNTVSGSAISPAVEVQFSDGLGAPISVAWVTVGTVTGPPACEIVQEERSGAGGLVVFDNLIANGACSGAVLGAIGHAVGYEPVTVPVESASFDITTPLPDLTVSGLSVSPAQPTVGEDTYFTATVYNVGPGATTGPAVLRFDLEHISTATTHREGEIPVIPAGGSATVTSGLPLHLQEGGWVVTATADDGNLHDEVNEGNNISGSLAFTVDPLPVTGGINGQVTLDGDPIGFATVTASTASGPIGSSSTTDASGYFHLFNLPAGNYTVTASVWGTFTWRRDVALGAGETLEVDFAGGQNASATVGTGGSTTWTLASPSSAVTICNDLGSSSCAYSGSIVTLQAVATSPSSDLDPPTWYSGTVEFYYAHPDQTFHTLIGSVSGSVLDFDNGTERFWPYSIDLDASGVPAGAIQLIAVGVDGFGNAYATPINANVTITNGALNEQN